VKLPKASLEVLQTTADSSSGKMWTAVLAATPIALTVLATILAGLSNSEMTLAQYHRALAAQNQSKAGDQWSLFQAKRIRGTSVEMTVDLLNALTNVDSAASLPVPELAHKVLHELEDAEKVARGLDEQLQRGSTKAGTRAAKAAAQLRMAAAEQAAVVKPLSERLDRDQQAGALREAVACLDNGELPQATISPIGDLTLQEALSAIETHRPDRDIAPMLGKISERTIETTWDICEDNIEIIDKADKRASDAIDRLGGSLQTLRSAAVRYQRALREARDAMESTDSTAAKEPLAALTRSGRTMDEETDQALKRFKIAQHGYAARRYRREAAFNEQAAKLYELQVRKSGLTSERHRTRAKQFFYGMLVAQAGVTVASLSLALRHKSLLWSLAAVSGIGAVVFGAYVYLYM
jgi:Domain of unknown function (DUF4337)